MNKSIPGADNHPSRERKPRHAGVTAVVSVSPADLFGRLDDQTRLAAHMGRSSMMTGGGRITYDFHDGRGQAVGLIFKCADVIGLEIVIDEVVTQREPPRRKRW